MVMPRELERLPRHSIDNTTSGLNVRFWHKADIVNTLIDVRFRE
jgi:hypothetical protein